MNNIFKLINSKLPMSPEAWQVTYCDFVNSHRQPNVWVCDF